MLTTRFLLCFGPQNSGSLAYKVFSHRSAVTEEYNVGIPRLGIGIKIEEREGIIIVPFGKAGEIYTRPPIDFVGSKQR